MKFVCQRDYPHWLYITRTGMEGEEFEKGKTSTVSSSACGLCCAVMMAHQLIPNCTFELADAIDLSYATKSNQGTNTIRALDGKMIDYVPSDEEIAKAIAKLPKI